MRIFLGFILIIFSTVSSALLPPFYQSAKEIVEILNNQEVSDKIGSGRVIHAIVRTETGYTITAGECVLTVKITYLPNPKGFVGPAQFEVHPDTFKCKQKR